MRSLTESLLLSQLNTVQPGPMQRLQQALKKDRGGLRCMACIAKLRDLTASILCRLLGPKNFHRLKWKLGLGLVSWFLRICSLAVSSKR